MVHFQIDYISKKHFVHHKWILILLQITLFSTTEFDLAVMVSLCTYIHYRAMWKPTRVYHFHFTSITLFQCKNLSRNIVCTHDP